MINFSKITESKWALRRRFPLHSMVSSKIEQIKLIHDEGSALS